MAAFTRSGSARHSRLNLFLICFLRGGTKGGWGWGVGEGEGQGWTLGVGLVEGGLVGVVDKER